MSVLEQMSEYRFGAWTRVFSTADIDPTFILKDVKNRRFIFRDAYTIADQLDMRAFARGTFNLVALSAEELPFHQRRTEVIKTLAKQRGYAPLPLWLAFALASRLQQRDLPSPFSVLMHAPVYVMQGDKSRTRPRLLALAQGDREPLVAAPRADAEDVWEEDRTFIFLA